MKLSLIIPNYNNEKYLKQCIESVLNQTHIPDEIIITDDSSSDNSVNLIKKYESKYSFIKSILREKNVGITRNRHEAILNASGNLITTLDSDDFYYGEQKLDKEMKLIIRHKAKNNKSIISYSNIVRVDSHGNLLKRTYNLKNIPEGNVFKILLNRSKPVPRDFIMWKDHYLEVGGYDLIIPIYEDWDLKLRLAVKFEYYYTGVDGVAYRIHDSGLSSKDKQKNRYWYKYVFKKNVCNLNLWQQIMAKTNLNLRNLKHMITHYIRS